MKKSLILGLTVLILSMGLVFVGCSTDSDDDGNNNNGGNNGTTYDNVPTELKGKWVYDLGYDTYDTMEFFTDTYQRTVSDSGTVVYEKLTISVDENTEFFTKTEYPSGYKISGIIKSHSDSSLIGTKNTLGSVYLNNDNSKFSLYGNSLYIYIKQP